MVNGQSQLFGELGWLNWVNRSYVGVYIVIKRQASCCIQEKHA